MRNATSVKERLKNYAKKNNRIVQDIFTVYVLERTLYRISVSDYRDKFTLKGGILLYGLFTEDFTRATTDIDLLGAKISNEAENMKVVFEEIFSQECDDPIVFKLDTLKVSNITEFKEYHGLNVSILAFLDRTRIPVSIDIGFGDIIYPDRVEMDYPTLLDDDPAKMYAYSIESTIAEKFEAIVSLGEANGRMKDFYDICSISGKRDMDGALLQTAIIETFHHRKTGFDEIVAFDEGFCEDPLRASRWRGFLKQKNVLAPIDFTDAIETIQQFLNPVVQAIREDNSFNGTWDSAAKAWK
ncbi:MAG: nucleotidyl transferase AbiEii/AbiGii toxin family protein [Lachnospiraceae bacterium]|nr:nucleotidyl transferase AbiEii/AbiGii toxin family protein [Lachnospiraceae bacterium]